jgi:hypothetical protein
MPAAARCWIASLTALSSIQPRSHATWSVIAVECRVGTDSRHRVGNRVVNRDDAVLMGVSSGGVVSGERESAACQAGVDNTHTTRLHVYTELQKGTDPARIIEPLVRRIPRFQSPAVLGIVRSHGTKRRPLRIVQRTT